MLKTVCLLLFVVGIVLIYFGLRNAQAGVKGWHWSLVFIGGLGVCGYGANILIKILEQQ